jgi:hypothetical protein
VASYPIAAPPQDARNSHGDAIRTSCSLWVINTGDIVMPVPGESPTGGHAMCIVGLVSEPANVALDGDRFIIRNSWGQAWGITSPTDRATERSRIGTSGGSA